MQFHELSLSDASQLVRQGALSPVELTEAYIKRIERLNPSLNCYIRYNPESALEQARQVEKILRCMHTSEMTSEMPLSGIPLAVKDLFDVGGLPTTAGSSFCKDRMATQDATTVTKLRQAGAIFLGKLNMHEIALGVTNVNPHYGACHNPWAVDHISGGSSGGSAAALAAQLCLGALGSDTGGSIRIPAALCGIVGLKPTYGRVSLKGVIPLSWNLDHAGPMGRQVRDVAIILQAIAGFDPGDPASVNRPVDQYLPQLEMGVHGWKIALASDDYWHTLTDPTITQATCQAAKVFQQLGARVEPVPFPGAQTAAQANGLITTCDAATFHRERLQNSPHGFGEDVLRRLQMGAAVTSTEYSQARRQQAVLRRIFEQFFEQYDLLLTPTTPIPAPLIVGPDAVEQARLLTRFTAPFNLTGLPAISLPCDFTKEGLPIGLQIITKPWNEARLLQAAYAYEQATAWHTHSPTL